MKALVWRSPEPGGVAVERVPEPVPSGGEALIRVGCAGVCGSDVTIVSGKHPRARPPLVLGHEFMGRVESLPRAPGGATAGPHGRGTVKLSRGQRVVVEPLLSCKTCAPCRAGFEHVCESLRLLGVEADGAFAELARAPLERVYPIPESVSDEEAAIIEPLAVAVHSANYGEASEGDAAVVLGAGPIGLLVAQVLRARGVSKLWVSEPDAYKLGLVEKLGFEAIDAGRLDPVGEVLKRTGGRGADLTFDAAGVPATGGQVIPMTGIRGRIVMVAIHKKPCEVAFRDLAYREQRILGVRIYARGDFAEAIELLGRGKVDLKPLISGVYPLEDGLEALAAAKSGKDVCKLLIKP